MSMLQFLSVLGGVVDTVFIEPLTITGATTVNSGTSAVARIEYLSNGTAEQFTNQGGQVVISNQWIANGDASRFEIFLADAGNTGGTVTGAALDTWLDFSADRLVQISLPDSTVTSAAQLLDVTIREITSPSNSYGPVRVELVADVDPEFGP